MQFQVYKCWGCLKDNINDEIINDEIINESDIISMESGFQKF
jgi:hypothetical protein